MWTSILSKLGLAIFMGILDRMSAWIQADKYAQIASENAALIAQQASVLAAAKLKADQLAAQQYLQEKARLEAAAHATIQAEHKIDPDVLGRWY